jgi:hypothetical protein
MSRVASALTTDQKKILQAKLTLGEEDEFYDIQRILKINSNIL